MSEELHKKEQEILAAVKKTLTLIIKDTATPPSLKHPLSDNTIIELRECLALISQREQELAKALGQEMNMRPYFVDEKSCGARNGSETRDGIVVDFPRPGDK